MILIYGTSNGAKLSAMRKRIRQNEIEIVGIGDYLPELPVVEETGQSPLENAVIKAKAYYEMLHRPVFSCDTGLYIQGLPEQLQPGIHVRTVKGRYLSDREMTEYYAGLAAEYGDLNCRYQNAICLVMDENHIYQSMDDTLASGQFLLTSVPCGNIRKKGFPLDCLSKDPVSGRYFYELEDVRTDKLAVEDGFDNFFSRSISAFLADIC